MTIWPSMSFQFEHDIVKYVSKLMPKSGETVHWPLDGNEFVFNIREDMPDKIEISPPVPDWLLTIKSIFQ